MPLSTSYRGRRAATIQSRDLRVTVLIEGGHIAEIHDMATDVNPLWTPPWPSMEPSLFDREKHSAYGAAVDASLLAGIMGHNLCLDIFGGPSQEEAAAGLPVHGEASLVIYDVYGSGNELTMKAHLPLAELQVERRIEIHARRVRIRETVQNLGGTDRPVGWTEHVTLGPPFLKKGSTQFRASAVRSRVHETPFGTADYLAPAQDFDWPDAPLANGGACDLRRFTEATSSSAYTAHLMDPAHRHAFFVAFSPEFELAFGYVWPRDAFPWLGIWEENVSRAQPPWHGQTLTRGMEFGVSPFPESRRQMVDRGRLFETPTYRWIPAASRVSVEYWCVCQTAAAVPETLEWPA